MRTELGAVDAMSIAMADPVGSGPEADVIDGFLEAVINEATRKNITFDILGGVIDGKVDLVKASDIDVICRSSTDAMEFARLALQKLAAFPRIRLLDKRVSPRGGLQLVLSYNSHVFMFDLVTGFMADDISYFDGRIFFELREQGVDARSVARFIKTKTGFKSAWPGLPSHVYSFRIVRVSHSARIRHFLRKALVNLGAYRTIGGASGVFVAGLGPDGSGKSAVIDAVSEGLNGARTIIPTLRFHWCPPISLAVANGPGKRRQAVTDPHGKRPWGRLLSYAKLAYLVVKFNAGFLLQPRRVLARGGFVFADRYFHDLWIDPKRYRFGGPEKLARYLFRFVPQPDVFLLFDAPPEVLQARKREVSPEETARQRQAYLELAATLPNAHVIDASRPLDEVVAEVQGIVLQYMAKRTARRFGLDQA